MSRNYDQKIAQKLGIRPEQAASAIRLLDEGNTIPFIARYRKEITDSLNEEQLRELHALLDSLRKLDDRRDTILKSIEEQGKLTPELQQQIETAESLTELEDLYQPYKPKRRTRASIARDRGLQGLADLILTQDRSGKSPQEWAQAYLNEEVPTVEDALAGARDIVAETISDHPDVRGRVRENALKSGMFFVEKILEADDEKNVYLDYYLYESSISRMKPHQVLAINRGEAEKILRVRIEIPEDAWQAPIRKIFPLYLDSPFAEHLDMASQDGAKRLLLPAIERDIRAHLTQQAELHAIKVFAANLRALLSQPPLLGYVVMGIDPAYRTGCKIAIVDPTGKVLETTTIYPHKPQQEKQGALRVLSNLLEKHQVGLIAIGNGTASRETEQLVAGLIRQFEDVHYLIVNEAGASVYSASPLAGKELPDMDVSMRGAVSIARRVLDPLAELVKIDPKSIGVGLYQHDVNQKQLSEALDGVVEMVVNRVGVDVNTASVSLLTYVAGIGPKLAENIVAYRNEHGRFESRADLKKVSGLGAKAFEQSAGFLRIRNGKNPLDASAIHPESYTIAKAILEKASLKPSTAPAEREVPLQNLRRQQPIHQLAAELGTGTPTLEDIFEQLVRPGRDPREDMPKPILRSDVMTMQDLLPGMRLKGTVRNVVDFGAFVDIGVKQDGLLHKSQIPRDTVVSLGDILDIEILTVDIERGRIGLGWVGKVE
jgi:uncharacterized protein